MPKTSHTLGPSGTIPPFEPGPDAGPGGRAWPARAAILVWIAASAVVWAILLASAAILL